jgi:hypothetical protein
VSYVQSSFTLAKRLDHEGEVEEAEEEAVLCRLYGVLLFTSTERTVAELLAAMLCFSGLPIL